MASSPDGLDPHVAHTGWASRASPPPVTGQALVFAAAFAAFLKSRTFWSESGSVTSATDRNEPSSA